VEEPTPSANAGRHTDFSEELFVIYHGASPTYKAEEHIYIFQLHCWLSTTESDGSKTAREEKCSWKKDLPISSAEQLKVM
jgi:hypothetical protein